MTRFLDTNVLVYARGDHRKGDIARGLLAEGGEISFQVLNEFTNVLRRKLGRNWAEIEAALADIGHVLPRPRPITAETYRAAMAVCRDVGCAFYDGLILASAQEAGCGELVSEDFQHGRVVRSVRVRNPFS